jgi:hypothetical protein
VEFLDDKSKASVPVSCVKDYVANYDEVISSLPDKKIQVTLYLYWSFFVQSMKKALEVARSMGADCGEEEKNDEPSISSMSLEKESIVFISRKPSDS